jgi:hypothetical protein
MLGNLPNPGSRMMLWARLRARLFVALVKLVCLLHADKFLDRGGSQLLPTKELFNLRSKRKGNRLVGALNRRTEVVGKSSDV